MWTIDGMRWGAIGALLLVGCSSGATSSATSGSAPPVATSSQPVTCAQRAGTYLAQFAYRSGTCGALSEQIYTMVTQPPSTVAPPCMGSIDYSADNCKVTFDTICPSAVAGDTVEQRGVANWSADASTGRALIEYIVTDKTGFVLCSGTYDLLETRQ